MTGFADLCHVMFSLTYGAVGRHSMRACNHLSRSVSLMSGMVCLLTV